MGPIVVPRSEKTDTPVRNHAGRTDGSITGRVVIGLWRGVGAGNVLSGGDVRVGVAADGVTDDVAGCGSGDFDVPADSAVDYPVDRTRPSRYPPPVREDRLSLKTVAAGFLDSP
jgi:hypothetical protein